MVITLFKENRFVLAGKSGETLQKVPSLLCFCVGGFFCLFCFVIYQQALDNISAMHQAISYFFPP